MTVIGGEPIPISKAVRLPETQLHPELKDTIHLGFFVVPFLRETVFLTDTAVARLKKETSLGNKNLIKWREFQRNDSNDEGLSFPDGYLDRVRKFAETQNPQREVYSDVRLGESCLQIGTGVSGHKSDVLYFRPSTEEMPDRFGSVHNHPRNTTFSITDAETFVSDPSAVVPLVTNPDGTIWIMSKISRVDQYTQDWRNDPDGIEREVKNLKAREKEADKLGEKAGNERCLELFANFGKIFPIEIYRIDPGTNKGVRCVGDKRF